MTKLTYRWSQLSDYPSLITIENSVWNDRNNPGPVHYISIADYQKHFKPGSQFIALLDEQPVGIISFNPRPPFESMRFTWDIGISIAQNHQHQGIGSQLMSALKKEAQTAGIHKISLNVLSSNPEAYQFYLKNGFVQEGQRHDEFYLNGQWVDDYAMAYFVE
ncbi:GNAT family N-acetyltransferase [Lapidilactobacillus bayanensis]|uniref:GNAT family N-acetyltransferase n=1 Tax=Lapidilactobacillus bayanensis TaxID=2485998 RepID=UPI000F79AAB4|nr:GNAT family N-acetyltransferase [Lapidilactobacillus bayanensis]